MTKFVRLALMAVTLTSATAALANNKYDPNWTDNSKPCGGFPCDSQQGSRAFWDSESDSGGR